jgi:hypothetical protein
VRVIVFRKTMLEINRHRSIRRVPQFHDIVSAIAPHGMSVLQVQNAAVPLPYSFHFTLITDHVS